MKNTPIERKLIDETIEEFNIADFSKATIREVKAIAAKAEATSGVEFIKMEMGVPGLPPSAVGVKAEIEALQNGIASLYPDINGLPTLKKKLHDLSKRSLMLMLHPKAVFLSQALCRVLLPLSSHAASVMRKRIQFYLSIRAFRFKSNSWLSWDRSMRHLMYMIIVATN